MNQAEVFFLFTRDRELQVEFYISQPFCPHQLKVKTDFHVAIDKVTTSTCGNFCILPVLFGLLTFVHHITKECMHSNIYEKLKTRLALELAMVQYSSSFNETLHFHVLLALALKSNWILLAKHDSSRIWNISRFSNWWKILLFHWHWCACAYKHCKRLLGILCLVSKNFP